MLVDLIPDPDLLRTMRELGLECSAMTVPLFARGRVLGALTFVSAESEHRYGEGDLALASDLAGRAAIAVDNARLLGQSRGTAALEREAILGQIPDGIVIADASGTTTFANSVAQSILGPRVVGIPAAAQAEAFNASRLTGEPYPVVIYPWYAPASTMKQIVEPGCRHPTPPWSEHHHRVFGNAGRGLRQPYETGGRGVVPRCHGAAHAGTAKGQFFVPPWHMI